MPQVVVLGKKMRIAQYAQFESIFFLSLTLSLSSKDELKRDNCAPSEDPDPLNRAGALRD